MPDEGDFAVGTGKNADIELVKSALERLGAGNKYEPAILENFSRFVAKRPGVFMHEGNLVESSVRSCLRFYASLHEFHEGDVTEVEHSLDQVNDRLISTLLEKKMTYTIAGQKVKILFG